MEWMNNDIHIKQYDKTTNFSLKLNGGLPR